MMKDIYRALAALAIIILLIFFWLMRERKSAKNEIIVEKQQEQIEVQNEVIKDKKIISQRQAVARAVSTNDNLAWLRQHRCKDCESR